mmetsp:Transcript_22823/g.43037  ORF Transcript_22823/g.43037 Transcript_22823/m.43037 type:complete len:97 (-) Transcript_22823:2261-2551(-)
MRPPINSVRHYRRPKQESSAFTLRTMRYHRRLHLRNPLQEGGGVKAIIDYCCKTTTPLPLASARRGPPIILDSDASVDACQKLIKSAAARNVGVDE